MGRTMGEFGGVWGKRVWRRPLVQAVTAHSTYAAVLDSLASNDPAPSGSKDRSFRLLGNMRKLELHRCLSNSSGMTKKLHDLARHSSRCWLGKPSFVHHSVCAQRIPMHMQTHAFTTHEAERTDKTKIELPSCPPPGKLLHVLRVTRESEGSAANRVTLTTTRRSRGEKRGLAHQKL